MVNIATGVIVILFVYLSTSSSASPNTELANVNFTVIPSRSVFAKKLMIFKNWVMQSTNSENTFVGRCFGIAKKLRFIIPLMIFLLGVIVTTLKFLTIFSLKGLAILVLLLILNIGPIFAKLALWKSEYSNPPQYAAPIAPPQTVHFHVHNDKSGHYDVAHSGPSFEPGWSDRISEGLGKTTSLAEKVELLNMYKRLGFNVNSQMLNDNYNR